MNLTITNYAKQIFQDKVEFIAAKLLNGSRFNKNGCLEWLGGTSRGYGSVMINRFIKLPSIMQSRCQRAHRIAYIFWKGEIPSGFLVMHSCDNRRCIFPDHLSAGTYKDNMRDASKKGRMTGPRGEKNHRNILTPEQVIKIRASHKPGVRGTGSRVLSKQFKVSRATIKAILKGVIWKHLL